jgi:hypothetical protein
MKCEWSTMLKGCLVLSSMCLGVPFIAPRQLGVVECISRRQFLPSVAWRTGHCPVRISFLLWRSRPLAVQSRCRTGHCPVPPFDRWLCHSSRVDYAADRWPGRLLAHRTVRWIIAVRRRWSPESSQFADASLAHRTLSGAPPDTVRCTQTEQTFGCFEPSFSNWIFSDSST